MIELDGGALTLEAVEAVARRGDEVTLAPAAIRALGAAREFVDRLAAGAEPIYGITTGVGKLKDVVIPPGQRVELQRNLVLSHAGGWAPRCRTSRSARSCCCSRLRSRVARPA